MQDSGTKALARTDRGEGRPLPSLITGDRLREAVTHGTFIEGGDPISVEGAKYDFHMGSLILKSSYGQAVDIDKLPEAERSAMRVDPGEVVFVLTRERLNLPANMIAVLTPKRKLAHSGIMVMGGLAVDPLYRGCLSIGLYNFSSTAFPLRPGKKIIGAMFYELADGEVGNFPVPESAGSEDFPDELVTLIKNYKPIEIRGLQDELEEAKRQIAALKNDFLTDRDWKRNFQDAVERQTREIDKLLEGLREEKVARQKEDERLRDRLDRMSNLFTGSKIIWAIVIFFVGVALTAFAEYFLPKMFGGH